MALTVIKRPQGHVLSTTSNTATVTSSSGALFTKVSHGLTTGDFIYVTSDYSAYNGYWYVTVVSSDTFRVYEYATATVQAYVNSGTVTYYESVYDHYWSCVHLPIVYKLKSDIWPTNGTDTARTITTFSNYNGYTYIVASGDIKSSGTASALEQVVLSGTSVDGVYKILNWFSDTNIVIDLAYSAANVLSSGTVQYYYFNYHAKVKVYGGIASGHTWQAQKPYELIATLKAVPDSSGVITLNIAEILKKKIEILNNDTAKDTLPNNLDAWCNFYISYAESYDDSNMYTVSEYTSSYTDDTTAGYAVNSKLAFKSIDAGYLSEYLGSARKFLTVFVEPTLFNGYYYDIGFLVDFNNGQLELKRQNYTDGSLTSTSYQLVTDYDQGVYRVPVVQHGSEDRIDFTLVANNTASFPLNISFSTSAVTSSSSNQTLNWFLPAGVAVTGTYSYSVSIAATADGGDSSNVTITYVHTDGTSTTVLTVTRTGSAGTDSASNQAFPTPTKDVVQITYSYLVVSVGPNANNVSASVTLNNDFVTGYATLSETKTININEDCANQNFYLTWLNNLGGFDYWNFTARKVYSIDVTSNSVSEKNIHSNWPKSYGAFADTIKQQTQRTSNEVIRVSSQFLTTQQEDAIKQIFSSPLVQQMTSRTDRRTVIVDPTTYKIRKDQDDLRTISFDLRYTDDIPSQGL